MPNVISYNAAISACVLSAVLPDVIPKLPPSVLERWEGKGSRPWVYGAVMQQPLLCPMSFPTMLPSVLVFCLLFCQMSFLRCRLQCWRDGPARAAGLGSWGGDAAAAVCPILFPTNAAISACVQSAVLPGVSHTLPPSVLVRGRQGQQALGLWGGGAAAAAVPNVISYNAAISVCVLPNMISYVAAISAYEMGWQGQQGQPSVLRVGPARPAGLGCMGR